LYLSEAAPTIFVLNDWLVNADSYRQPTIGKFLESNQTTENCFLFFLLSFSIAEKVCNPARRD
jgi:hypothetical protein